MRRHDEREGDAGDGERGIHGRRGEVAAQRLQQVRRPRGRGGCAAAVLREGTRSEILKNSIYAGSTHLDDSRARARCDDGGSRAHIEGVVPISARPDDIDDEVLIDPLHRRLQCACPEDVRGGREEFWPTLDALDVQGGQKRSDLDRENDIWGEDALEGYLEVVRGEVLGCLDELSEERLEGILRNWRQHGGRRKLGE